MKKGCLTLLFILIVGSGIEYMLLEQRAITLPWFVTILLALSITIVAANIAGLFTNFKKWRVISIDSSQWKDGMFLGLSGRISALKAPLKAPFSGRPAVVYEYDVESETTLVNDSETSNSATSTSKTSVLSGFGMAPCGIQSQRGTVKLIGFPIMANFPSAYFGEPSHLKAAATYISSTKWKQQSGSIGAALRQLGEVLNDADGELKEDFITNRGMFPILDGDRLPEVDTAAPSEVLSDSPQDRADSVAYYEDELSQGAYSFKEVVVAPGDIVSAFGIYTSNPPRLNIGSGMTHLSHGLFAGEAGSLVRKGIFWSFFAVLFWGTVCAGAHLYVYAPEMAWKIVADISGK